MKKVLTVVLDGFGYREEEYGNAIKQANAKNFNKLWEKYPHTTLFASEEYVGLNKHEFGNSEIGHMTIGAGRKIKQHGPRITEFLNESYKNNNEFNKFLEEAKTKEVHIIGLYSEGNVHSNLEHFISMYKILKENDTKKIHFHLITDGRDTDIHASLDYIRSLEELLNNDDLADITSISGRYYAMDRDTNYERTKKYYDLITKGIGEKHSKPSESVTSQYEKGITDEFLNPIIIDPSNTIKNGDIVIWMNYRSDRAKQILKAFTKDNFKEFETINYSSINIYSFFPIGDDIKINTFLDDIEVTNPLGIYLSSLGISQARIAETEKYAHVTYFLDGMYNGDISNCENILIPSPKVKTYDLKPEMSALEVTRAAIYTMEHGKEFIFINYANADMVGHTGDMDATIKAVKAVDFCLGKLYEASLENDYTMIILADHGNADIMLDAENKKVTTHTISKVPFIITDDSIELKNSGDLTEVAPTILKYMNISLPEEMQYTDFLIV